MLPPVVPHEVGSLQCHKSIRVVFDDHRPQASQRRSDLLVAAPANFKN